MVAPKLFRCDNRKCHDARGRPCNFTFSPTVDDPDPTCPKCQTKANDPVHGSCIVRLPAVHFDPPSHIIGRGTGRRACEVEKGIAVGEQHMAGTELPNPFHAGTGDPRFVTCPSCRATEVWRKEMQAMHDEEPSGAYEAAIAQLQTFVVAHPDAAPTPAAVPAEVPA